MPPWDVANLTWLQIEELYFHQREEDGTIKIPNPPGGETTFLAQMAELLAIKSITTPDSWDKAVRDCCAKWGQPLPPGFEK